MGVVDEKPLLWPLLHNHACMPSTVVPFTLRLEMASDLYLPRLQDVSVLAHALKQSVVSVSQSVSQSDWKITQTMFVTER